MPGFADVAIPVGTRRTFSYAIPSQLLDAVAVGARVVVPFGKEILTGICVGLHRERPAGDFRLRQIRELLDPRPMIPDELVRIGLWVAERYFAPPGEVLRALFPVGTEVCGVQRVTLAPHTARLLEGGLRPPGLAPQEETVLDVLVHGGPLSVKQLAERSGLRFPDRWVESLAAARWITVETELRRPKIRARERLGIKRTAVAAEEAAGLTPAQKRLYSLLEHEATAVPLQEALQAAKCNSAVARSLARKGLVEFASLQIQRMPADLAETVARSAHVLTAAQGRVFETLQAALEKRHPLRFLLHGVTASGKTEIYLRLIAEVLRRGETALYLVPEIGLTPLLSRIAVSHFPDRVALLHSGMSDGERFDQWDRIRAGRAPVVVGTRSAVFAPLAALRLVVMDEEQDTSYKQNESPCYHAREVAWRRMEQANGILLMGSATPSVETYYLAREKHEIEYLCLPERIEARPLARVTVVNMADEFQRHGRKTVVSQTLHQGLEECLRRGEQCILLLNRRGFARTLLCRSCGHSVSCLECSVSMTYHQQEDRLICHYCGAEKVPPAKCENCGGQYIYYVGVGTEQLEEIVRTMLPQARLARMDRDTTRRKGALRRILLDFARGKLDMLVGTQMIAKGHDFPNVTLVGVVGADAGLSFPDFRSAERTFQILTQVAGRAGRGATPGQVIIQSFHPDHYALQYAGRQDYDGFYRREIDYRKLLGYPPIRELVQILVVDTDAEKATRAGERIAEALKASGARLSAASRPHVLGPAPAPLEKLRGKYRVQLLMKSGLGADNLQVLREAFEQLAAQKLPMKNVHVDVDPLSLM